MIKIPIINLNYYEVIRSIGNEMFEKIYLIKHKKTNREYIACISFKKQQEIHSIFMINKLISYLKIDNPVFLPPKQE